MKKKKSDLLSERNCSAKNNEYVLANVETQYVRGDVENFGADSTERINYPKKDSHEAITESPASTSVRTVWKPQMKDPWLSEGSGEQETFCWFW